MRTIISQFNNLNNKTVSRAKLETLLRLAQKEKATEVVKRLQKVLRENDDLSFEITIKDSLKEKQGLNVTTDYTVENALLYAEKELYGKTIYHRDIHKKIHFTKSGIAKAINGKNKPTRTRIQLIFVCKDLLQKSRLYKTEKDKKNRKEILKFHTFRALTHFDGSQFEVIFKVKETLSGVLYYDHTGVKIKKQTNVPVEKTELLSRVDLPLENGKPLSQGKDNKKHTKKANINKKNDSNTPRPLLAPNGALTRLTPAQYDYVRTIEFKKWFGDFENDPENASEVLDENEEPLVVYPVLDEYIIRGLENNGLGCFTDDIDIANVSNGFFLNIRKPNNLTEKDIEKSNTFFHSNNIDGLVVDYDLYVPFYPNQIKLAIDSNKEKGLSLPPHGTHIPINSVAAKMIMGYERIREYYEISDPQIAKFLGKIEKKTKESVAITIAGEQGSQKTRLVFQLIKAFGSYKIGHASIEEHPDSELYEKKLREYVPQKVWSNLTAPEIDNIADVHELVKNNDVIIIDSFTKLQEMQRNIGLDKDFRKAYDGKLFIIIYQMTTGKTMRGGSKSQYDGDIIIFLQKESDYTKNYAYFNKNRYNHGNLEELKYSVYHQKLVKPAKEVKLKFKVK